MWCVITMRAIFFCMIIPTCFTKEHHDDLASHVVRGQECSDDSDKPEKTIVCERIEKDFIL